jgi:hypothetical protein
MATGIENLGLGSDAGRAAAALLFIASSTNAMDVYSALNSSPWTAESFGGDPEKAAACREYVWHALAVTSFYAGAGAVIGKSPWPIIGFVPAAGYMYWLYWRALNRAVERDSKGWNG